MSDLLHTGTFSTRSMEASSAAKVAEKQQWRRENVVAAKMRKHGRTRLALHTGKLSFPGKLRKTKFSS